MPHYLYFNPNTNEIREVFQKMSEAHVYETEGVKWERVWTKPTASVDVKIDPFSEKDFISKTSNKKETYGSMWDRSKEISEKREQKAGVDSVKKQYFKKWSDKRKGKKHFLDT